MTCPYCMGFRLPDDFLDSGMEMESTKDGYCVTPDSKFVQEFKDASFKLKEGEYTEELVVNQSYGYFIIKRLPFDDEYVESPNNRPEQG